MAKQLRESQRELQVTPGEPLLAEGELQTQPAVPGTLPWAALDDKQLHKNSRHGL